MVKQKKIIVLVGPSGSGKTSLGQALSKRGYKKLVTTTTRKPRPNEVDGVDYYFTDRAAIDPADFVEQTQYNQHIYGLTKREIKDSLADNQVVHVSLDKNGAEVLKNLWPDETIVVFITVSREEMAKRMAKRGDQQPVIQERLDHCQETGELTPPPETDYVVQNHDMDQAVSELLNIINDNQ